jgi:hypothetical protein
MWLGVKGVGKSSLLSVLRDFTAQQYPQVLLVWHEFSLQDKSSCLFALLVRRIQRQFSRKCAEEFRACLEKNKDHTMSERVLRFDHLLATFNIKVLFLLDDFHVVYQMPPTIGAVIVDQVALWSDSELGTTHMIVTGDTVLRKLAFSRTSGLDLTGYPSFIHGNPALDELYLLGWPAPPNETKVRSPSFPRPS